MHKPLLSAQEVDDFIILRIRTFARKVQRVVVRDALKDEGLALLEWQLLFSVARFGSCHLAHITRRTSIDPAHGSRAVAALEKKGLISRHEDPENRRRKVISLTEDGKEVFNRIWPRARAVMRNVTDQMSQSDFATLKQLLEFINHAAPPLTDDALDQQETQKFALSAE